MGKQNTENTELFNIRISSLKERNPVTNYTKQLEAAGFVYNERANWYSSYFELRNAEENEKEQWELFAKNNKLKVMCVSEVYTRGSDYRATYFKTYEPAVHAKYRCAYCGRKFKRKDITVDHIFPVNKLMYQKTTRDLAKMYGIHGANEPKNLVAACKSCNSKKGTNMGSWIIRGFIGRSEMIWKIRYALRFAAICAVVYFVAKGTDASFDINTWLQLFANKGFGV